MHLPDPEFPLPSGPPDVDRECAENIRAGVLLAFETFYHALSPVLYAFVRSLVQDTDVAEDLVQDSFVRLWDRRESLDPTQSLRAYLFTIARNNALDYLRRESATRRITADLAVVATRSETRATDPAESAELAEVVEQAIAALPDRVRTAFLLQWQQGLSYAEIADIMGITRKTVENQLGRAVKLLRDALSSYHG